MVRARSRQAPRPRSCMSEYILNTVCTVVGASGLFPGDVAWPPPARAAKPRARKSTPTSRQLSPPPPPGGVGATRRMGAGACPAGVRDVIRGAGARVRRLLTTNPPQPAAPPLPALLRGIPGKTVHPAEPCWPRGARTPPPPYPSFRFHRFPFSASVSFPPAGSGRHSPLGSAPPRPSPPPSPSLAVLLGGWQHADACVCPPPPRTLQDEPPRARMGAACAVCPPPAAPPTPPSAYMYCTVATSRGVCGWDAATARDGGPPLPTRARVGSEGVGCHSRASTSAAALGRGSRGWGAGCQEAAAPAAGGADVQVCTGGAREAPPPCPRAAVSASGGRDGGIQGGQWEVRAGVPLFPPPLQEAPPSKARAAAADSSTRTLPHGHRRCG